MTSVLGEDIGAFLDYAKEKGLECLVETHNEKEIEIALDNDAYIVGINNRDLKTLNIDLKTTQRLSTLIPDNKIKISESGIDSKRSLEFVLKYTDCAWIGTSIMKSENIRKKIEELVR